MAIGERIRFIRNLRGITQKWLGQAVGFPPKTADVRMAQYESGSRTPKEDLVKAIANVLEVSPLALQIPDIDSDLGFIHTLFAIEDIHGIRAEKQGDEVHLIFDGSKRTMDESIFTMLSAWAEQSKKLRQDKQRAVRPLALHLSGRGHHPALGKSTVAGTERSACGSVQGSAERKMNIEKARTDIQSVRASIIWRSL